MHQDFAIVGFGEAGRAFAEGIAGRARIYDRKSDTPATRSAIDEACTQLGVVAMPTNRTAVDGVPLVLSLVTAAEALGAARETAEGIATGSLYCDMNSVAPQTKRLASDAIERGGGRYVDVAVMAPVEPARRAVPLLVSGPHASAGAAALTGLGFTAVRIVTGGIGAASAVKMIRSVMIKGMEALTAECALAAEMAGIRAEVFASLGTTWPGADWSSRVDYNLDRMIVHGTRRAAEMEEVAITLEALGVGATMTHATAEWQRAVGSLGLIPAANLDAKLHDLLDRFRDRAT